MLFLYHSSNCFAQQDLKQLFDVGKTAIEFHDYTTSIKYLSRLLEIRPNYQEARYLRGKSKYLLHDYSGCINDMDILLKMNPSHRDAYELMGLAYTQLSDYQSAANAFRKSTNYEDSSYETWQNLAYSLLKCYDYSAADTVIDYMNQRWHDKASIHILKARSTFGLGDYFLSECQVDSALAIDSYNLDALTLKGNFLMLSSKWEEAIRFYSQALYVHPKNILILLRRGLCYSQINDQTHKLEDFKIAYDIAPTDPVASRCLSYSDNKNVINSIIDSLTNSPDFILGKETAFIALNVDNVKDNYDLLVPHYLTEFQKDAYRLDKSFDNGYNNLLLREYMKAITDYTISISSSPEIPECYFHRSFAYAKLGKYGEAISDLDKAISLRPNYADAYYNRGLLHVWLNEEETALLDFSKAGELGIDYAYEIIKKIHQ